MQDELTWDEYDQMRYNEAEYEGMRIPCGGCDREIDKEDVNVAPQWQGRTLYMCDDCYYA